MRDNLEKLDDTPIGMIVGDDDDDALIDDTVVASIQANDQVLQGDGVSNLGRTSPIVTTAQKAE
jgi:hypothetical protein